MLNLVITLLSAASAFAAGFIWFGVGSAIFMGLAAAVAVYIPLARRVGKRVEAATREVEADIGAQRTERAIERLESLRPFARWQPRLGSWLDAQIGILRFAHLRDFDGARPYLERATVRTWQARAMLGAYHYRRKQWDDMERVFEQATRRNRKEGMLWATYSWCQWKRGRREDAIRVLAQGRRYVPKDTRLQRNLEALQNAKKMKMQSFGPEWLALHLEERGAAVATGPQWLPPGALGPRSRGRRIR